MIDHRGDELLQRRDQQAAGIPDGPEGHGGGKLIEPDGPEATLIKMWISLP